MVNPKPFPDHCRCVVLPLDQPAPVDIADAFLLRREVFKVVSVSSFPADPPSGKAFDNDFLRDFQENDLINFDILNQLGLLHSPGIPVEDNFFFSFRRFPDQAGGDRVGHEPAFPDRPGDFFPEGGLVFDLSPQQFPGRDGTEVEISVDAVKLDDIVPLPLPGGPKRINFMPGSKILWFIMVWGRWQKQT